jgi:uncharacterized Zn finger protein
VTAKVSGAEIYSVRMDRVCRQGDGLFSTPAGIRFSCSRPDSASLCKHVAAALYGTGARLDAEPDLLFRLRAVDAGGLFADLDAALPAARGSATGPRLDSGDLSEIFGIDMAAPASAPRGKASTPAKPPRARQSPAIPNAPVQEPGRRPGRKPSMPAPSRAAAESATPARKRKFPHMTIFKKGVRKTRK